MAAAPNATEDNAASYSSTTAIPTPLPHHLKTCHTQPTGLGFQQVIWGWPVPIPIQPIPGYPREFTNPCYALVVLAICIVSAYYDLLYHSKHERRGYSCRPQVSLPATTPSVARNASRGVILATRIVSACCDLLYHLKCELRFLLPKCLCLPQPLSLLETQAEKLFLCSTSVSAYHDPSIATSGGVLAIHIVSACYHHPLLLEMQADRLFLPPTLSQPATTLSITWSLYCFFDYCICLIEP